MCHIIVSTSKNWCCIHAFRRIETARHDVTAVQTGTEDTLFQFLVFVFENLDSSERDVTRKKR
jgi:hypothetical protein